MARYYCHDHPEVLALESRILDARPGGVVLACTPFHPGGGGQLPDRGSLRWQGGEARVTGFDVDGDRLVTGAQLNDDGTARMDFDLPGADNDRLRALEPALDDVIRQDLAVRSAWVDAQAAAAVPGLLRSRAVAPPPHADGTIRIVEIAGLDRQACGGTHLVSTGQSPRLRILKIDNKGRHNRRVRIGFERGESPAGPRRAG